MRVAQKGEKGIPMADAFAAQFPLTGSTDATCTRIPVVVFDKWCEAQGYYALSDDQDTINKNRNLTKNRINHTARNEAWLKSGKDPFQIEVRDHGISYSVYPTDAAFKRKSVSTPAQIKSLLGTKRQVLSELMMSVDLNALSVETRIELKWLDSWMDRYEHDIVYATQEIQNKFVSVQKKLAAEVSTNAALSSGAVTKMIETDGDIEQTYEDLFGYVDQDKNKEEEAELVYDVEEEADYIAMVLNGLKESPEGDDLVEAVARHSRFALDEDGFSAEEVQELVEAVEARLHQ